MYFSLEDINCLFLIDSSNIDTLSAVYSSLIAGQTLLKCQYLLFFLEHHFQKDCNSFGDTSLIFNAWGVPIQTKSSFYYSSPLFWSQGWLTYPPSWLSLGSSRSASVILRHSAPATSSDDPCSLEKGTPQWLGPLMVKVLDFNLFDCIRYGIWLSCLPSWSSVSRVNMKQGLAQYWDIKHNKKSFCCHMTAWS